MIKILLVDDETSFSATLGERLQLRGFDICLAKTGQQAIAMTTTEKPHVVLLDRGLPDMDGLKVMDKIKEIDADIEVIILSGYCIEQQDEGLVQGAFKYLMKPVKLVDLVEVISCAMEHRT